MDAFFASIEIRDQPALRGLPVIVGGVSRRGVVCAASYEARKFGVRSAMPTFQARRLCPVGVFLAPDMDKYARVSQAIHRVLLEFTSEIEPIALDEAYLDVTGSLNLFGDALALGTELKRRVRETTDLVVSVGIGPNKLIAKIACTLGKPDGLAVVSQQQAAKLLEPLPIRRLWGIGQVTEKSLTDQGIVTIGDLARTPLGQLESTLGSRAQDLLQMAQGYDERPVESNREHQSIGEECTFEHDTQEAAVISATITTHSEAIARRLRRLQLRAFTITLKVRLARARGSQLNRTSADVNAPRYPLLTRSKTLPNPVQDGEGIRVVALELWRQAKFNEPLRLVGVSVSHFEAAATTQLELFAANRKHDRLGAALDAIQDRFGPGAIRRAVDAPEKLTPSPQQKPGESGPRRQR